MKLKHNINIKAYLALIAAIIIWGLSFVATKVALKGFTTFTLIFGRFGLAAVLFLALMPRYGFPRFTRKDHGMIFLTALFEPGLYFIFETFGLQYTTAPEASLIIAAIPISVLVLAYLLLGERSGFADLFGIVVSVLGIILLITGSPDFSWDLSGHLLGDLLIIGAVITASLYITSARSLGKTYSAFEITSMQSIYGALFYLPAFLWEFPRMKWSAVSGASVGALVFLTLFATVGAFLCYNYALTKVPATRAAVFTNGIPVVTVVAACILIGEKLSLIQAGGGTLVLLGVCLTNFIKLPGRIKEL